MTGGQMMRRPQICVKRYFLSLSYCVVGQKVSDLMSKGRLAPRAREVVDKWTENHWEIPIPHLLVRNSQEA
jgi:hypothetical protein